MKLSLFHFIVALVWAAASVRGQNAAPPAKLKLPDTLATTAASRIVSGQTWAYVVWQPSDPVWLKGRTLAVYLKPGALTVAGNFIRLGTAAPVTDQTALKVLIQRGWTLGDSEATVTQLTTELYTAWKVGAQAVETDPVKRMAALINRAAQQEKDAAVLRQVSVAHPSVRLGMGLAWGGPVAVAAGNAATIEVREFNPATGADIQVLGRCQFTAPVGAGAPAPLPAPGQPVQVPDLSVEGHLRVKLRWALSDALRRKALETTGFRVWRLPAGVFAPASPAPTAATLNVIPGAKIVTRSPALATKLFREGTPANADDVRNFTADPATFFTGDDNNRDELAEIPNSNPKEYQKVGTPLPENSVAYTYYVAALDWLGQPGAISPAGTGFSCSTVPPPVPSDLKAEEILTSPGGAETLGFRLSFDAPAGGGSAATAQRYAIYRGGSGPTSLDQLDQLVPDPERPLPAGQPGLAAAATVNRTASRMTWNDPLKLTGEDQFNKSIWYAVRAIHDSPCGPVYSAPSPPVFATWHSQTGPNAPSGVPLADCPQALIKLDTTAIVDRDRDAALPLWKMRTVRLVVERLDNDIAEAAFYVVSEETPPQIVLASPRAVYAPGEKKVYGDFFWADPDSLRAFGGTVPSFRNLTFVAVVKSRDGAYSFYSWKTAAWGDSGFTASTTQMTEIRFQAKTLPTSKMWNTDAFAAPRLEAAPLAGNTTAKGQSVSIPLSNGNFSGRMAVVRIIRAGLPIEDTVGLVQGSAVLCYDALRNQPGAAVPAYQVQLLRSNQTGSGGNGWNLPPYFHAASPGDSPQPPVWGIPRLPWPPSRPECPVNPKPATGGESPGVIILISLTPGTKEYRLYRQIDGGPQMLIAQGAGEYTSGGLNTLMTEDQPNLPSAGHVCYFAQLLDGNGNPSPLAPVGCVDIVPPLPVPVVSPPEPLGTSAAPQMKVTWFCAPTGVRRFMIRVVDTTDVSGAVSSSQAVLLSSQAAAVYFEKTGGDGLPPVEVTGRLFTLTPAVPPPGSPAGTLPSPQQSATFNVALNHEYKVEVWSQGVSDSDVQRSLPQTFIWRALAPAGSVAWPARPLPRVINGSAFNVGAVLLTPQMVASQGPITWLSEDTTPVLVPIGVIATDPGGFTTARPTPALTSDSNYQYPLVRADTTSVFYRGTQNPNAYLTQIPAVGKALSETILPAVLYRQITSSQDRNTTDTADLVQVSPLISSIQWRTEGGFAAILDPMIAAFPVRYPNDAYLVSLNIPDLHPVLPKTTYRYFLVRFAADGEIDQVIDCGSVLTN